MSDGEPTDLLSRLQEVEQRRRLEAVSGLVSTVAVGQLLFAAFAFGHSRGPMGLALTEVLMGSTGALVLAVGFASVRRHRRLERRAERVVKLREGRHTRRVALFERYLSIDDEVVLLAAVKDVEAGSGTLTLRYLDPRAGGPVLREFEGSTDALESVAKALGAQTS